MSDKHHPPGATRRQILRHLSRAAETYPSSPIAQMFIEAAEQLERRLKAFPELADQPAAEPSATAINLRTKEKNPMRSFEELEARDQAIRAKMASIEKQLARRNPKSRRAQKLRDERDALGAEHDEILEDKSELLRRQRLSVDTPIGARAKRFLLPGLSLIETG